VRPVISPSLLACNLLRLEEEIKEIEKAGADFHHIDVMDGHFVPNLSFGLPLIQAVKKISTIPLDVHIMVSNPDHVFKDYLEAGADLLTFHIEASHHPHRTIQKIKEYGAKAGIALNPGTSESIIEPLLNDLDLVLIMSVNPGFGGQDFIPSALQKAKKLSQLKLASKNSSLMISMDGGISSQNIALVASAGVNCFVSGSHIFSASNRKAKIDELRKLAT
jgi:ribulose-phosphate 3-epimerase